MTKIISKYIPEEGKKLSKYTGTELIERVGDDIIKEIVGSILCGGNVRSLTEGLTQRRISLSNASLLITYLKATKNIKNIETQFFNSVKSEMLENKLSSEEKLYLQWFIGLTGKSIQNVLRSNPDEIENYLSELNKNIANSTKQSKRLFGELQANISIDNTNYLLNWPSIFQLFLAIGTQTLAIRGSEKSMYGKLFEKLILGSLLSILRFKQIDPENTSKKNKVFWLSQRLTKRESDATLLYKPGKGARFDIGFIGPGNTEISLDKVSRFEREMEFGRQLHFMSTIIIVDRIGEGSRIVKLAKNIDGNIVQMSMNYWVKEVAEILHKKLGYTNKILKMKNEQSVFYIKEEMQKIDLNSFV